MKLYFNVYLKEDNKEIFLKTLDSIEVEDIEYNEFFTKLHLIDMKFTDFSITHSGSYIMKVSFNNFNLK